jgi:hypothetical protein
LAKQNTSKSRSSRRTRCYREGLRKRVHNVVVFMAPYLVGR